jgi:hypothetical protein
MTPDRAHVLRRLFEQAIEPYIDETLRARVTAAREEWYGDAQEALAEQIDDDMLEEIRTEAAERLDELRDQIDDINEKLQIAADRFTLPPISVPEAEVALDPVRQALVSFDHGWVEATRALKRRKSYGQDDGGAP